MTSLESRLKHSEATLEESCKTYKGLLKDLGKQLQAAHGDLEAKEQKQVRCRAACACPSQPACAPVLELQRNPT